MTTAPEFAATALTPLHDGSHDFDFLRGRWKVHHRRLRHPLSGSSEWYEFDGTAVERSLWDCQANVEELDAKLPDGRLRGLALRLYSPSSRQWAIHWSTAENGTLDQPMMIGDFRNGCGEFYNQEEFEARSIFVRFFWMSITWEKCRWEQAYSADRGRTWETNWVMDFTRAALRR
jgi:hypothetical protein